MIGVLTLAQEVRVIEGFGATEWTNQTHLHPLALAMVVLSGLAVIGLPRRFAVWPVVLMLCFVAPAQRLVLGGLDFNLIRILVMFGAVRVALRQEFGGLRWCWTDLLIFCSAFVRTIAFSIQQTSVHSLIYQFGQSFDSIGMYFLFRCLIRSWDDVIWCVVGFAAISVPVAGMFILENRTGHNVFSVFGGVPEITKIRDGRLRCQGAFSHPIIAGCFWAAVLPCMMALWWLRGWARSIAVAGSCATMVIVVLTASSTPITAVAFGFFAWGMFVLRAQMKWVLIAVSAAGLTLHMLMEKPIWHLITRITITSGNTGYHRYRLIDAAVEHADEWFLVGTPTTAHWFWGAQDVTNQYILEAVTGGIITLALFVALIVLSYRYCGRLWRLESGQRWSLMLSWALGVTLFVHCTSFIGVSYFGQATPLWYLHLAMITSMYQFSLGRRIARSHATVHIGPRSVRVRLERQSSGSSPVAPMV